MSNGIQKKYSPEELSQSMGLHPATIRALLRSGALEGEKVGRKWLVTAAAVRRFAREHRYNPEEPERAALMQAVQHASIERVREALALVTGKPDPMAPPPRDVMTGRFVPRQKAAPADSQAV